MREMKSFLKFYNELAKEIRAWAVDEYGTRALPNELTMHMMDAMLLERIASSLERVEKLLSTEKKVK